MNQHTSTLANFERALAGYVPEASELTQHMTVMTRAMVADHLTDRTLCLTAKSKTGPLVTWHTPDISSFVELQKCVSTILHNRKKLDGEESPGSYINLAPRPLTIYGNHPAYVAGCAIGKNTTRVRGGKNQIDTPPAAWWIDLDLDVAGHRHKSTGLPTAEDFSSMLTQLTHWSLEPTFVTFTGGGVHLYFVSTEDLTIEEWCEGAKHLAGWLRHCETEMGLKLDVGPSTDIARMLRAPGSPTKSGHGICHIITPDPIARLESHTYAPADFAVLPQRERSEMKKAIVPSAVTNSFTKPAGSHTTSRPGDGLNTLAGADALLAALGCRKDTETRWTYPRADGAFGDCAIEVKDDDGGARIHAYGERAARDFGQAQLAPFTLFTRIFCNDDASLAARICLTHGVQAPMHCHGRTVDELRSEFPVRESSPSLTMPEGSVLDSVPPIPPAAPQHRSRAVQGQPLRMLDAVERGGWTLIHHEPNKGGTWLVARLGGLNHGVWEVTTQWANGDGESEGHHEAVYQRLASWVPFRSKVTRAFRGDEPVADATYDVTVIARTGTATVAGLSAADSVNPAKLTEAVDLGLELPSSRVHLNHLRTCLQTLGREDRTEEIMYVSTGWTLVDGKHVFAAPAGSPWHEGTRTDLSVHTTAGSQWQRSVGWPACPSDSVAVRAALSAVGGLMRLVPDAPTLGVALTGVAFAAPLALKQRTTVVLVGPPGTRKSLCAGFATGLIRDDWNRSFAISVPVSSPAGALGELAWSRHLPCFADDYRRGRGADSASANMTALNVARTIIQSAYSTVEERKKTQTGQLRSTEPVECASILTAETIIAEPALVQRTITVKLAHDSIPAEDAPDNPITTFEQRHHPEELNQGFGWYLSRLAHLLDARWTSVAAMSEAKAHEVAQLRKEFGDGRAGENVAYLAVGLSTLYDIATEADCIDVLPDWAWVMTQLRNLVQSTAEVSSAEVLGTQVLETLRTILQDGNGHLLAHDGTSPEKNLLFASGWRRLNTDSPGSWAPRGDQIGTWSADSGTVFISVGAVRTIKRIGNLEGLSDSQIKEELARLHTGSSSPGDRISTATGIGDKNTRPRGYLIPAAQLMDLTIHTNADTGKQVSSTEDPEF